MLNIEKQAIEILEQALSRAPDEMDRFVAEACEDNEALRARVEKLVAAFQSNTSLLRSAALEKTEGEPLGNSCLDRQGQNTQQRLAAGTRLLDRYEIGTSLGRGGMGEVYRGYDTLLGRDVAIKVLSDRVERQRGMSQRFQREMRSVAALTHPNVVTLYDFAVDAGAEGDTAEGNIAFAVMEFVDGATLRKLIPAERDHGTLVQWALGIASGLAAAHARSLMHRDIKPENIVIGRDGIPKILDFGLARSETPSAEQDLTGNVSVNPGTVPYMSPEQADGQSLSCATDVFSFGIVLYEMFSGRNPFRGRTLLETLRRVSSAQVPELDQELVDCPAALRQIIGRMLERSPTGRIDITEVVDSIRSLVLPDNAAVTASGERHETSRRDDLLDEDPTDSFIPPQTKYVVCHGLHIAHQVFGSGNANLVIAPGFISNIDNSWASRHLAHWQRRLGEFAQVAVFDKRGTGLSDRVTTLPSMDDRMEDVCAVMDEVGFESAAILGISEGGSLASLFAATYPHRCNALVLHGSFAKFESWYETEAELENLFQYIRHHWGSGTSLPMFAPDSAADPDLQQWWGKFERMGANPGAAIELMKMNSQIDVSAILPAIQAETLVIRRDHDVLIDPQAGEYLAKHIPNAKLLRSPGRDHLPWVGDGVDQELSAIGELLTETTHIEVADQVLATVMVLHDIDPEALHRVGSLNQRFRGTHLFEHNGYWVSTFDGPARAVHCGRAILQASPNCRIGLHIAEITLRDSGVSGDGVDQSASVCRSAAPGEILITRPLHDLVAGADFRLTKRELREDDSDLGSELYQVSKFE